MRRMLSVCFVLSLAAAPALAQDSGASSADVYNSVVPPQARQPVRHTDDDRIAAIAEADLAEVRLADQALSRSQSPAVREMAARMKAEHLGRYQALQQIARAEGRAFPSSPAANTQLVDQRLAELSGPAFDRAYVDEAVLLQHQAVARLDELGRSDSAALRGFATRALPTARRAAQQADRDVTRL